MATITLTQSRLRQAIASRTTGNKAYEINNNNNNMFKPAELLLKLKFQFTELCLESVLYICVA